MKKIIKITLILCMMISLLSCKSKEEKADDYAKNGEYKKAYDLLYNLDQDHSKADDCLVSWCLYCLDNVINDEQLSNVKFIKLENAQKVYRKITRYSNINAFDKNRSQTILNVISTMEDFYKDDETIKNMEKVLQANIQEEEENEVIQHYLTNYQYQEAYEYAYKLDEDHTRAKQCILKWYQYCISNETLDQNLACIELDDDLANEILANLADYLINKAKPNKEQCQFALSILELLESFADEADSRRIAIVEKSLHYMMDGKYIWNIPEQNSLSYDKYYSTVHYYNEKSLNGYDNNFIASQWNYGIITYILDDNKILDEQCYLFCDLGKIRSITDINSNANGFDGYWFYYIDDEDNTVNRIDVNGNIEQILSNEELNGNSAGYGFVLDRDVYYTYTNDGNSVTVYRAYIPDKVVEKYTVCSYKVETFELCIPEDSDHLTYYTDNPECVKKAEGLKNSKGDIYRLLTKYIEIDKDIFNIYQDSEVYDAYFSLILDCISQEYKLYRYSVFNYDIKTGKTSISNE